MTKCATHVVEEIQSELCILHGVGDFLPAATFSSPTSNSSLSFFERMKKELGYLIQN
jgi:hypothetical protein